MSRINTTRWILGGIVAGVIVNVVEFAGSVLYAGQMQAVATAHDLKVSMSGGSIALGVAMGFISGLVAIWFYAVARSHFGPGPATAFRVAVVLWIGGYMLHLLGYSLMGLFSGPMLWTWGAVSLVEMIAGTLAGAAVYKESAV